MGITPSFPIHAELAKSQHGLSKYGNTTTVFVMMPSNPLGPSAEAIAPVALFRGLLTYHAPAAVVITFKLLNDAAVAPAAPLPPGASAATVEELEGSFTDTMFDGCEGLVVKNLSSTYRPGARSAAGPATSPSPRHQDLGAARNSD